MNKMPRKEGISISIRDMFLYLIGRWRTILIGLLAGIVVLGAFGVYRNLKNGNSGGNLDLESKAKSIAENMNATDLANAENNATTFMHYLSQYEYYSKYDEKSLFQNLNPQNTYVTVLTYIVSDEENDAAELESIASAYENAVINDDFIAAVCESFNCDEADAFYYYDGMIACGIYDADSANEATNTDRHIKVSDGSETSGGTFIVRIYGEDEDYLETMTALVKDSLEGLTKQISDKINDHTLELVDETTKHADDTYIYDRQESYITNIKTVLSMAGSLKEALDADLLTYTKYLLLQRYDGDYINVLFDDIDESDASGSLLSGLSVKYVVLGAAAGFIIALVIILIYYLAKCVLRCYDDIEFVYGITVLGTFDDSCAAAKRHKSRFDKWIWSKRIRRKLRERESDVALIATKLRLLAKNNSVSNICVAFGPDVICDDSFMQDVIAKMNESGDSIKVTACKDILRNADAIEAILEADGVVLLEQMDKSKFSKIDEECVMCDSNSIPVLGVIVAE